MHRRKRTIRWALITVTFGLLLAVVSGFHADIPLAELEAKYADQASEFIDIRGMPVHYRDQGDGPILLLLHGTGASLHTWDGWVDQLLPHFRIVRLDLPGFGLTGPDPDGDYSIKRYVDFVEQFAAALQLDKFHLAGSSLGGQIGWHYALTHPAQIDRLVLLAASGYPRQTRSKPPFVFRLARTPVVNRLLTVITPRSIHRRSVYDVYGDASKVTDSLVERYFELSLRPGNRQAFVDRANTEGSGAAMNPADITQATLILWGTEDRWVPVEDGQSFAMDIPNAELIVYEGVGHVPMEEIPLRSASATLEFLSR